MKTLRPFLFVAATFWLPGLSEAGVHPHPAPVDDTTWNLDSWRQWPFAYELVSRGSAPLVPEDSGDWVRTGDSWVAGRDEPDLAEDPEIKSGVPFGYAELEVTEFFITGGGNEHGPNRIFCASAVPKGPVGPFPVLFVFHGGGGHASGALALGVARRNPGFATVAVDYNGQFRPVDAPVTRWVTVTETLRESRHDLIPNPLNFPMYHYTQAARRALDWVEQQTWADASRFGAVGISYGGWLSFFLAGVDARISSIYTTVSSAGTDGMRGRASQPLDWAPGDQVPIWKRNADPIQYAAQSRARVFLNLSTNDRFFWLDGAALHRDMFPEAAEWVVTPNKDHGNGGPDLPNPIGLWHRAVHMDSVPFPSFHEISLPQGDNRLFSTSISADRPLKSVHLAWSPGNEVSPARYWRWIECIERAGAWSAAIPSGFSGLEGHVYFAAVDVDGRAVSSDLVRFPGRPIQTALIWGDGCLWDLESGAAAWRSDLAFDKCRFETTSEGAVLIQPIQAGAKAVGFTNSFVLPATELKEQKGIRLEVDGNGTTFQARVILARDVTSLDEQRYAAEVEIPGQAVTLDLPWTAFHPFGPATTQSVPLPANSLVIECESLPATGLTIGKATWLP